MTAVRFIVLVRHGETVGESSIRYYGATDVLLSDLGRSQAREAATLLDGREFGLVVASPLLRAHESAQIVAPSAEIRVDERLREIDFGLWEGLTAAEIEVRDPELFRAWRAQEPGFEYPRGEPRERFRARIASSAKAIVESGERAVLVVVHKGVIRQLVRELAGAELEEGLPELGGIVELVRDVAGSFEVGDART